MASRLDREMGDGGEGQRDQRGEHDHKNTLAAIPAPPIRRQPAHPLLVRELHLSVRLAFYVRLAIPRRRRQAITVLCRRQAIVIGPTPPGTGVMAPATSEAAAK